MAFHPFTTLGATLFALLFLVANVGSFVAADQLHCEMSLEFKTLQEQEDVPVPDLNLLRYGVLHLLSGAFDQTAGANNWITSSQFQSYQLEKSTEDSELILIPDDFDDEDLDDSEESDHEDPQNRELRHGSSKSSTYTKPLPSKGKPLYWNFYNDPIRPPNFPYGRYGPSQCWYLTTTRYWACTNDLIDYERQKIDYAAIRAEIQANRDKKKNQASKKNDNDDNSRRGLRHSSRYAKKPTRRPTRKPKRQPIGDTRKGIPERFKDPRCLLDSKCYVEYQTAKSISNSYWMNADVDVGVLCNLCRDDDDDPYKKRRNVARERQAARRYVQCKKYGNCRKLTVDHFARGLVGEEHMDSALNSTDLHTKFEQSVCNGLRLFTDDFPTFETSMDCKIAFHCANVNKDEYEYEEDFESEDEFVEVDNRDFLHRRDLGGDSSNNITLYSITAP